MKRGPFNGWAVSVGGAILLGCHVWLGIWGAVGSASGEVGVDPESAFQEANRLYELGDFEPAAAAYQRLMEVGPGSAPLHFNLGNALFKSGRIGQAIWHYRTALDLSPRDADVRANLEFARNLVGTPVREGRIRRWVDVLTVDEWSVVSGVLLWCGMGGVVVGQLRPQLGRSLRFWVRIVALAWVISVLALGVALHGQFGRRTAIMVAEEPIRYGPFEESQTHFLGRDGMEFRVLDAREGWVEVEDSNRSSGWIDRSSVVLYPGDQGTGWFGEKDRGAGGF